MSESSLSYTVAGERTATPRWPLPPDDRRREIVEAIIPLLLDRGSSLSTREIADAAGVAEGTVFSVFPDKASVIIEAVKATVDPGATCADLDAICVDAPLDEQLVSAARSLMERSERIGILVGVLRTVQPSHGGKPPGAHRFISESHATILASVTGMFESHEHQLAVSPQRAATVFWGLVFANAHVLTESDDKLDPSEIAHVVLNGIVAHDAELMS